MLGGFILYSAFMPACQVAAKLMGGISMVGYALLVALVGGYNESIYKVLMVDLVGIVSLLAAAVVKYGVRPG